MVAARHALVPPFLTCRFEILAVHFRQKVRVEADSERRDKYSAHLFERLTGQGDERLEQIAQAQECLADAAIFDVGE